MREGPILTAAGNFVARIVNGDNAPAGEGPKIRVPLFIEGQVPGGDGPRPVVEDAVEGLRPLGKVGQVVGRGKVRAAFGPIGVFRGKRIVHAGHRRGFTDVAVPCNAVDVFIRFRYAQLADGSAPQIVVVVQHPNLCGRASLAQRRAKEVLHKRDFILLRPFTCGHSAILLGVDFVLHGDRIDLYAFCLVGLKKLEEILGIRLEAARWHGSAQHGAVGLHPSRRTPRRRKEKQLGIRLAGTAQQRQDIGLVMVDGELLHLRVGLCALVEAVYAPRIVAGADAGAAHIQRHLAGSEQVVHDFLLLVRRNLAKHVTGGIRQRPAKAKDFLLCGAGIERDGVGRNLCGGLPLQRIALHVAPIAKRGPDLDRPRLRTLGGPYRNLPGNSQCRGGCRSGLQKPSA